MFAIIDYMMGNTRSVFNSFKLLDQEVIVTNDKRIISKSDGIILPGVGAFSDGMNNLKKLDLINILNEEVIDKKKFYFGICLGLQFLAKKSFEDGEHDGFGWLDGTVRKIITNEETLKIPHMGWNDTKIIMENQLFNEIKNPIFYYLHSYYLDLEKSNHKYIAAICDYGGTKIISTLQKDNIYAVQFHPEKSQNTGLKLIKNFVDRVNNHVKT